MDAKSRILILGSMPSVTSLSHQQYYGHPQNRFWKIFASLYDTTFLDYDSKIAFLHRQRIALWDVVASCKREGSLDSNISDITDNDIVSLVKAYPGIQRVICNGNMAGSIYRKQFAGHIGIPYVVLPSTSPANASYSLERLLEFWKPALQLHNEE